MIKLENKDIDLSFQCEIIGYQFPEIEHSEWDSNWYNVKIVVCQRENVFEKVDPALTTYGLVKIRDWFKNLSENKLPYSTTLTFTEPCIEFKLLGRDEEGVRIIIELNCELEPDFKLTDYLCHEGSYLAKYEEQEETKYWDMVFTLTDDDFKRVLIGLDETIEKFPIRK